MTKVKLKDATRELLKGAEDTLSKLSGMRKSADALAQLAKKQENQFAREEQRRRAQEKQAAQERREAEGQWWVSVLVAFAIIAIAVAIIVVGRFSRMMQLR